MYDQHRISKLKTQEIPMNDTDKGPYFKIGKRHDRVAHEKELPMINKMITNVITNTF